MHVLAFMRRAENRGLSAWLPRRPTGAIDSIELAELLLERGADPVETDAEPWATPRPWAAKRDHQDVLAELDASV